MKKVIGLGAGGHAGVMVDILRRRSDLALVGLLDLRRELWQTRVHDLPVLGDDTCLPDLLKQGTADSFFIGVGSVGDTHPRQRLFELALTAGFAPICVIHPSALVAPSVTIGRGATLMPGCILNAGVRLGDNVIINTGAIVEHDSHIGDHAHIAPGVTMAGAVRVGRGAHIGLGAVVCQHVAIGDDAIVGAGAVVRHDVAPRTVVVGVPARVLRMQGERPPQA